MNEELKIKENINTKPPSIKADDDKLVKSPVNSLNSFNQKAISVNNDYTTKTTQNTPNEKTEKPNLLYTSQLFTKSGKMDVPAIFYLDIDTLEKKGWQEENANQSDYFNYGKNI